MAQRKVLARSPIMHTPTHMRERTHARTQTHTETDTHTYNITAAWAVDREFVCIVLDLFDIPLAPFGVPLGSLWPSFGVPLVVLGHLWDPFGVSSG